MRAERAAIVAALCLVLAVACYLVYGFERTLRDGQLVLLELAPADPRSLMQGDYMALRFAVDAQLPESGASIPDYAYLHRGAEGRAVRTDRGAPLGTGRGVVSRRIRR